MSQTCWLYSCRHLVSCTVCTVSWRPDMCLHLAVPSYHAVATAVLCWLFISKAPV